MQFARDNRDERIIPVVALAEVTHLLHKHVSHQAMSIFIQVIAHANEAIEPITRDDLKRAHSIMSKYADAHFDFADCAIMALAERLNITRVCTFDRRDFALFKPAHCP